MTLVARIAGSDERIVCGRGAWQKGRFAWAKLSEQPVAASGAWTGDDTFMAKLCFYETPFTVTITLKPSGNELSCRVESNVRLVPHEGIATHG